MIGRVVSRPRRPHRLLKYLFGSGRNEEHVSPRLVAAWAGHPGHLEPPGEWYRHAIKPACGQP